MFKRKLVIVSLKLKNLVIAKGLLCVCTVRIMPKMWALTSIWLQFSLVSGSVIWLKSCFDFYSHFYFAIYFFLHHFSCCFAWYLASHTRLLISPNTIIPSLPHPHLSSHCTHWSLFPTHHCRPWLLSRQRCQIDEEHGRCSPHAKQTPPTWPPTWRRTGTGAQCRYTPLTWSTSSPHPIPVESDLSHRIKYRMEYFKIKTCEHKYNSFQWKYFLFKKFVHVIVYCCLVLADIIDLKVIWITSKYLPPLDVTVTITLTGHGARRLLSIELMLFTNTYWHWLAGSGSPNITTTVSV